MPEKYRPLNFILVDPGGLNNNNNNNNNNLLFKPLRCLCYTAFAYTILFIHS